MLSVIIKTHYALTLFIWNLASVCLDGCVYRYLANSMMEKNGFGYKINCNIFKLKAHSKQSSVCVYYYNIITISDSQMK